MGNKTQQIVMVKREWFRGLEEDNNNNNDVDEADFREQSEGKRKRE